MSKKQYMRNEFVIDPETDQDLVEYVRQLKSTEDFSGFIRDLLRRAMSGDLMAQTDIVIMSELNDLRAVVHDIQVQLAKLELVDKHDQEVKHLWREVGRLNERLEQLRVYGAVEDDELTTPVSIEDAREAVLSAKLKKLSFGELM